MLRVWSSFLSLEGLSERLVNGSVVVWDANNPPLVLDENSAKSSSRTRFCEGFHGGDFYDSHSFFLSQSGENFVEIESDDDDAIE